MLEWLKSAWSRWKVQVSVVGGVLVIATAYGTCSVEPPPVSEATPTTTEPATAVETVEVSATTSAATNTADNATDATTAE